MLNLNAGAEETPQTPNPTAQAKIRKKIGTVPKIVFGAALLLVIPMLGNTLAGSITITNPQGKVEFGQGVAQAVVCDSNGVTITPTAAYRSGVFVLETITVTGLDLSANGCRGKSLALYVVDNSYCFSHLDYRYHERWLNVRFRWRIRNRSSSCSGFKSLLPL